MKTKVLIGVALFTALCGGRARATDLGEVLLKKGLITEDELQQAREEEKQKAAADESRLDALKAKLPAWLNTITPFGDFRVRGEGFYENDVTGRTRERVRARVGLTANPSNEVSGTFRLATGDANDPISTNQTFSNAFNRKSINLDWAYITLKPGKSIGLQPGWFSITGGKFGVNTFKTSELVWDDDVSPEGATETLYLVDQRENFVRGLRINALQWVIDETSNAGDPWIAGGQVVADTAFSESAKWTFAFGDYNYGDVNKIATKFLSPVSGNAAFGNCSPNANPPSNYACYGTNSSYNSSLANSNTVRLSSPDSAKKQKILGFANGFNIINANTELNFADLFGRGRSAGIFADLAYNSLADTKNTGVYAGVGVGSSGKDWYHNNLKNQGDWAVTYIYAWVEKDAVFSLFSFSDIDYSRLQNATQTQKGSSNVIANMIRTDYVLLPGLQLTAKANLINALDRNDATNPLGQPLTRPGNSTLARIQLDAVVKF
ncbi:MAG TPA: putative porin [Candidatus Binatia bacterium]|nr:putative porin [Candidatus Binatia bacterium]